MFVCQRIHKQRTGLFDRFCSFQLFEPAVRREISEKSTVIKNSELNEIYGYQIFSGKRIPSRDKLISISFGLELSLEETQTLLKYAGFAPLYPKQKRDSLLIWGKNHQFSIYQINELLYTENEDTL